MAGGAAAPGAGTVRPGPLWRTCFIRLTALPGPVLGAIGGVLGVVLLATIGGAQWWVLRRVRPRSGFWVPATGASWAVGLGVFAAVTTPLWRPGQPTALVVAIGLLGGLLMAATVAALTGFALLRLVRPVAARTAGGGR